MILRPCQDAISRGPGRLARRSRDACTNHPRCASHNDGWRADGTGLVSRGQRRRGQHRPAGNRHCDRDQHRHQHRRQARQDRQRPVAIAITPSPRAVHHAPVGRVLDSWAYDPAQRDIVLFGGDGGHGAPSTGPLYGKTWTWNGTTWTRQHPAASPSPRAGAAMAWDPATCQLLLFGGGTFPDSYHFFASTWTWNGTTWTRWHPATSPSPRENPDMFYDAALHEIILFGGNAPTDSPHYANHYDNQTWAWNGRTWTRLHPAASPSPRDSGSLVYDPAARTAIMYGGYNDTRRLSDTWSFNGRSWTRLHPASTPGSDSPVSQAAYDRATRQLVLYGGDVGLAGPYSHDMWTWNGSTWAPLDPATIPGPRGYGAMTYDQATRRIVLFGGSNGTTDPNSIWDWNGTTWQLGT